MRAAGGIPFFKFGDRLRSDTREYFSKSMAAYRRHVRTCEGKKRHESGTGVSTYRHVVIVVQLHSLQEWANSKVTIGAISVTLLPSRDTYKQLARSRLDSGGGAGGTSGWGEER